MRTRTFVSVALLVVGLGSGLLASADRVYQFAGGPEVHGVPWLARGDW
ncbi:MAG TPA: hypothetical protein VGG73_17395 [Vicinamibacterales bacterium]|jgi:hypothetical protein